MTKKKALANFEDIISQGSFTSSDYNLNLGGLGTTMFRKACSNNFVQFASDVEIVGVAAQGDLTIGAVPTADDTITIDTTTYTYKDGDTAASGQIGIGAAVTILSAQLSTDAAINGTDSYNTAHTTVSANSNRITAKSTGVAGNSIATTSSFTSGSNSFDDTTLGTVTTGVTAYALPTLNPMMGGEFIDEIRADLNANFAILDTEINP